MKFNEKLLKCPRCNIKMDKIKKENIILDVCSKCHGMWADAGELDKLAEIANKQFKGEKNGKE